MTTVLLIGASRGIGHELARQYIADGWRVIASGQAVSHEPWKEAPAGTREDRPAGNFPAAGRRLQGRARGTKPGSAVPGVKEYRQHIDRRTIRQPVATSADGACPGSART